MAATEFSGTCFCIQYMLFIGSYIVWRRSGSRTRHELMKDGKMCVLCRFSVIQDMANPRSKKKTATGLLFLLVELKYLTDCNSAAQAVLKFTYLHISV